MKAEQKIKQIRKTVSKQTGLLFLFCVLLMILGRVFIWNDNVLMNKLYNDPALRKIEDLRINWDGKQMKISDIWIEEDILKVSLEPEEKGRYTLEIFDKEDHFVLFERLYVGPFNTVYSIDTGNFTGDTAVVLGIMIFQIGMFIIFAGYYKQLKGPLLYSYDAILSLGIAVFMLVSFPNFIYLFIMRAFFPHSLNMLRVYGSLSGATQMFVMLSSPLLLIFAIMMIISNIALLRHESFRISNILGLGIGISLVILLGLGIYSQARYYSGSENYIKIITTINSVYFTVFTYFECILLSSAVNGLRAARHQPDYDKDYIIVLGCGFNDDGTLPPLIKGRVDKALDFYQKQKEKNGKEAHFITSGGQGNDEPFPEAQAMGNYLRSKDIPEDHILQEERSTNTLENMRFSKKIIDDRGDGESKVIFSTTNYHVFRSGMWAGLAGLEAEGIGSKTKWWFWPNAFMRECIGLLYKYIVPEIIWMIILTIFFGILAYLSFPLS